jgi:hypothetical protein
LPHGVSRLCELIHSKHVILKCPIYVLVINRLAYCKYYAVDIKAVKYHCRLHFSADVIMQCDLKFLCVKIHDVTIANNVTDEFSDSLVIVVMVDRTG